MQWESARVKNNTPACVVVCAPNAPNMCVDFETIDLFWMGCGVEWIELSYTCAMRKWGMCALDVKYIVDA